MKIIKSPNTNVTDIVSKYEGFLYDPTRLQTVSVFIEIIELQALLAEIKHLRKQRSELLDLIDENIK